MKKKKYILLVGLLTLCSCDGNIQVPSSINSNNTTVTTSEDGTPSLDGYNLYWNDEFDLDSLDLESWSYQTGNGAGGWGNQEIQYYKSDNVTIEDGNLCINVKKENVANFQYTSARIRTADKVSIKYGRIEARIALPAIEGLWPAFWMLPESDSPYGTWASNGEIDIMEARGRVPDMTSAALHYGKANQSTYQSKTKIFRDSTIEDYHVYALEWEEDEMRWYVDDDCFFTMSNKEGVPGPKWYSEAAPDSTTAPFDWDFHVLLNVAVGGHFDGFVTPPSDFVDAQMKVDYVRMYKPIA